MNSSGINAHKLGCYLNKNETFLRFFPFCLPVAKPSSVVYNENNKGPRTEPWGIPNKSLQRSDKVEPIFID